MLKDGSGDERVFNSGFVDRVVVLGTSVEGATEDEGSDTLRSPFSAVRR